MRFRFTIRDLLWLILAAGLLVNWRLAVMPQGPLRSIWIKTDSGVEILVEAGTGRITEIDPRRIPDSTSAQTSPSGNASCRIQAPITLTDCPLIASIKIIRHHNRPPLSAVTKPLY